MWGRTKIAYSLPCLGFLIFAGSMSYVLGQQSKFHVSLNQHKEPYFTLRVDERFNRPLIRFTPPKDDEGRRPHDIVKVFLSRVRENNTKEARELVLLEPNSHGPTKAVSIGENGLKIACERFREFVRNGVVTLSGSAINSKSDFWTIRYIAKTANGEEYDRAFVLRQRSGSWFIIEKSTWTEWTRKTYSFNLGKSKKSSAPLW